MLRDDVNYCELRLVIVHYFCAVAAPSLVCIWRERDAKGPEQRTPPYLSISTILRLNLHFGSCAPPFMKSITGDALLSETRNRSTFQHFGSEGGTSV